MISVVDDIWAIRNHPTDQLNHVLKCLEFMGSAS